MNIVFNSKDIKFFFSLKQLEYEVGFKFTGDNAETVLGNSIRNAVEKCFPWIAVKPAKKRPINDRIRCTLRLMGAGRFWMTEDCGSLQTAFTDAVWDNEKDKDERLDDGSTDIDSLDAFEYTIERDMKYLIQEVAIRN